MIKFVSGVGTDIGKTHITLELMKSHAARGLKVAAIKPIETGVKSAPQDGLKLFELSTRLNPELAGISLQDVVPVCFELPASPFVASSCAPIDYALIEEKISKLAALCDVLFIEGAGGLFVPLDAERTMEHFCALANETILILRDGLGTISDFLAYKKATAAQNVKFLINLRNEAEFNRISKPFFDTQENIFYFPRDLARI